MGSIEVFDACRWCIDYVSSVRLPRANGEIHDYILANDCTIAAYGVKPIVDDVIAQRALCFEDLARLQDYASCLSLGRTSQGHC